MAAAAVFARAFAARAAGAAFLASTSLFTTAAAILAGALAAFGARAAFVAAGFGDFRGVLVEIGGFRKRRQAGHVDKSQEKHGSA